jgi:hypothetical protein|nr:hypothetical protein [Candidatus Acidoferrales bacterium]
MRRAQLLIFGAWLIFAAAWFLPVITDGERFPGGLPGWQAFRTALGPVWPYISGTAYSAIGAVAAVLSAVTTILFVVVFIGGSPWLVWRGSRSVRRISAWVAVGAFLLDAHWYFFYGMNQSGLMIGYFLWWFSFLVMALGLFDLAGRRGVDSGRAEAA